MPCSCCILSKFYIKPQRSKCYDVGWLCCILSKFYIKPQRIPHLLCFSIVVSYRNSTSNHNICGFDWVDTTLYLIEILHQTTTRSASCTAAAALYLIEILHQTTTIFVATAVYRELYLIEILHQTTTREATG